MGGARSKRTFAVTALLGLFVFFLFLTTLKSHEKDADLTGHTIMPKLGNETAKAELGRAAWKLLHTTMARFPDEPTKDESSALKAYIHLFQRLYPCGECAEHFRKIITKYPPQVSSRSNAAGWACHVHNEVNKSLDKPLFNCANIGDFYDCGCADDEKDAKKAKTSKAGAKAKASEAGAKEADTELGKKPTAGTAHEKPEMSSDRKELLTGDNGRDIDNDALLPVLQKEE